MERTSVIFSNDTPFLSCNRLSKTEVVHYNRDNKYAHTKDHNFTKTVYLVGYNAYIILCLQSNGQEHTQNSQL